MIGLTSFTYLLKTLIINHLDAYPVNSCNAILLDANYHNIQKSRKKNWNSILYN